MTNPKTSRRRSTPTSAPTPAVPPVSPTEQMNVKRYDVHHQCVLPRGGALVFRAGTHPSPPYLQQGQRMFPGMVIESAPEYVDELVRNGDIAEHVEAKPETMGIEPNGT